LVLTRSVGERVIIGDDIVVVVSEIIGARGGDRPKVRLAFSAPKGVNIDREEVRLAKQLHPRDGAEGGK
jgi:carbon storage regulator CsrA